jgi:hypothetical protein
MQLNRPANAPEFNRMLRKIQPGAEPITIKAGIILGLNDENESPMKRTEGGSTYKRENVALVSCLLGCLKHIKHESGSETLSIVEQQKNQYSSKLAQLSNNMSKDFEFPA